MDTKTTETWRDWQIEVWGQDEHCSHFSFAVISPEGVRQEVKMGGENRNRALERAKEWIDTELALGANTTE